MSTGAISPVPISEFENTKLRDSVLAALATVPAGHGNAFLNIDNKGAGGMWVQRFEGDSEWTVALAGRVNFADRGFSVQVAASWK